MTTPDPLKPFAAGFMDDYFAEAEEHLVAMRRCLLTLEGAVGSKLPGAVLEELFRTCHSLKGISAMVELREAELVAHHMESSLRALRLERVTLTEENFEVLIDAAKALESVIAARRANTPAPAVDGFVTALKTFAQDEGHNRASALEAGQAATAASTPPLWRVTFVPSPDLVARGVKIDAIRARLLDIGQILSVAPKISASGGMSFEFDVETSDEAQLAAWRDDGLTYELLPRRPSLDHPAASDHGLSGGETGPDLKRPNDVSIGGQTNFVRVDLARLDELMRIIGDMVVTRARLEDTLQRVEAHVPFQEGRALQEHSLGLERQLRDLREAVMRVRLVPVGEIFRRMPFVVRDLARDSGKRVQLDIAGQATEIDKFLIERMMDPIIHLVRNAISHAVETPDQRVAAGKSPDGTIRLSASTSGESVILEVSDDGRGIDVRSVASRARAAGLAILDGPIDGPALLDILCTSGFSTREEADRASGRGVGLAVVRSTVEELDGQLTLETRPGAGTTFRISLPLTLTITDAIIANVGDRTFAIPQAAVREVIEVDAAALRVIERNELFTYRGATLPMIRLARLFSIATEPRSRLHAIVIGKGPSAVGLLTDRITGQREIVVKTISDPLIRVEGVSGATELGDGRLVLILDVAALARSLRDRPRMVEGRSA